MSDETKIFLGTPSKDEILQYFARQQSKQRIKQLEEEIDDRDSSPELSDSFKIELDIRKKKIEEEKMKLAMDLKFDKENKEPASSNINKKKLSLVKPSENATINDESFLEMEKMCERTLNLNNVTEAFIDLTSLEDEEPPNESFLNEIKKKKSLGIGDETRITEIEAPSFLFNNTSLISPNKNSPIKMIRENRPSTIMEVTETSISNRTAASSYVTAKSSGSEEKSEYYQTANESLEDETTLMTKINKPSLKPFFNDTLDLTKDSLDGSEKIQKNDEMTIDSLNTNSKADSSSGVESSFEANNALDESVNFDDTLERIDYMMAQACKMKEDAALKTPVNQINKLTPTPKGQMKNISPAASKSSPTQWSANKIKPQPQSISKLKLTPNTSNKNSPLIKFSPMATNKSPANFKLPVKPVSTSKIAQFNSGSHNKKFQHIVSPISRYINHTPELPLGTNAHIQYGATSSRHFNFRDSESFSNSSLNTSVQASSLPMRAKTKTTSSVKQVIDQRTTPKIPGGKKVQELLANSSPTVIVHKGHVKADTHDIFHNNTFDDTALSEQSFADLSLMTGDVSIQVVEGVKRVK